MIDGDDGSSNEEDIACDGDNNNNDDNDDTLIPAIDSGLITIGGPLAKPLNMLMIPEITKIHFPLGFFANDVTLSRLAILIKGVNTPFK